MTCVQLFIGLRHGKACTYHVTLAGVHGPGQALDGHPLDWQLRPVVGAGVILAVVDVSAQAEVGNFHQHVLVNPVNHQAASARNNVCMVGFLHSHVRSADVYECSVQVIAL